MEAVQASERQIPCGLCGGLVPESAFRSGSARMFQGVLYCPSCSREADRAKLETVAFKQSLEAGGLYTCGRCNSPVPIADIRSGAVIYFSGVLSCSKCSLDLRNILKGRTDAAPGARSQRFQRSELGVVSGSPSQRFDSPLKSSQAASGSQRFAPRPEGVAAASQRFPARPEIQVPQGRASQRFAPPPGEGSQRFSTPAGGTGRAAPSDPGAGRAAPSDPGAGRAAPSEPGAGGSRRITGPQPKVSLDAPRPQQRSGEIPVVTCAGCDARVAPEDVTSGRALVKGKESYCPTCRDKIDNILRSSADDLADLTKFACSSCNRVVTAEDLMEERAARYRGQVYCSSCKADFGRTANPQQARGPAATQIAEVSCARCDRKIPPIDLRTGKTLDVGGRLHCRHCRAELEQAQKTVEKRLAKAISCAHCSRSISPKEIKDKKVTQHEGNVYCAICSKDVGVVLFGRESGDPDREGACRGCGGALIPGASTDVCESCQAKLDRATDEASEELEKTQTIPCDKCNTPITLDEISSWKAGFDDGKVLCLKCQSEAAAGKKQAKAVAARCSRCRGPLPPGRAPGKDVTCDKCLAVSVEDEKDVEAAVSLSGEVELKCGTCRRAVSREDLIEKRAVSIDGKLRCSNCKGKGLSTPVPVKGKPCGACEKPIAGAPFVFGARNFCATCKPEFERILKGAALKGQKPCASCKKPASGEGALEIQGKAFCASCKRAADYLVMATVTERRGKPPRQAPPVAAVGGISGVAVLVALFMLLRTFGSTVVITPPTGPTTVNDDGPRSDTLVTKAVEISRLTSKKYDEAAQNVKKIEDLKGEATNPADVAAITEIMNKVIVARDHFVPLEVNRYLDEAEKAYKKHEAPGDGSTVLLTVPPAILETRDGVRIKAGRDKYVQLTNCYRRAQDLIASQAEERFISMGQLLTSPESRSCGFLETRIGKELDSQFRLLSNAAQEKRRLTPPDPTVLKKAVALETAGTNIPGARSAYLQYLQLDSDNLEALVGLTRCNLELEKHEEANDNLYRVQALAAGQPSAAILGAWVAWTDGATQCDVRAREVLKNVPKGELGRLGRRLTFLLDLGPPTKQARLWRLWAPGASADTIEKAEHDLTATIERLAAVYGVRKDAHLDIFLFRDDAEAHDLKKKLDVVVEVGEGRFGGCHAIGLSDVTLLKTTVARALGARSQGVPKWLLETVPEAVASSFLVDGGKLPTLPSVSLEELEKTKDLKANPKALEAARTYAHLASDPLGAEQLANYVQNVHSADPKRARADLDAQYKSYHLKMSALRSQ